MTFDSSSFGILPLEDTEHTSLLRASELGHQPSLECKQQPLRLPKYPWYSEHLVPGPFLVTGGPLLLIVAYLGCVL